MPLTLAQMQALINDNAAGEIVPTDHRAVNEALWRHIHAPYSVDDADDIWWEGDSAGMTTVAVSGTQTITERDGSLSVQFSGQTANDVNALLKPVTFSIGDEWVTHLQLWSVPKATSGNRSVAGLCFTDGTDATSNAVLANIQTDPSSDAAGIWVGRDGTLTNLIAADWVFVPQINFGGGIAGIYVKLVYSAANTFQMFVSPNGIVWTKFSEPDITITMTPTHVGVAWGEDTDSTIHIATFGPLCKVA